MPIEVRIITKVVFLFLLISCSRNTEGDKIDYKIFVEIDTVKFGDLKRTFKAWCIARPSKVISVVSHVEGVIKKINFKPGEYVKKGDTFAEIYRGPIYKEVPVILSSDGILDGIFVDEGSPVRVGTVLGLISRGGKEVDIYIPLRMRKNVRVGSEFFLGNKMGKINFISNVPNDSILSFLAKGKIQGDVETGIYTCDVVLERVNGVHFVRSSAILGDTLVYRVIGDRVRAVRVRRIFEDDEGNVAILSDLKRGDTVVVLGGEMLKDGSRVTF